MVELRKLLEQMGRDLRRKYPILNFYCNWVVHSSKDRDNQAIVEIIQKIDNSIITGHNFPDKKYFMPSDDSGLEFISLAHLKNDMKKFFDQLDLPNSIFSDNKWSPFRDLLIQVLRDQPIKNPTDTVKLVCFRPSIKGAAILEIEFKNGRAEHSFKQMF